MKKSKLLALLLALCVLFGALAGCAAKTEPEKAAEPAATGDSAAAETPAETPEAPEASSAVEESAFFGPIYDEWSDMTDEELYELAKQEGGEINVYATSSKMMKAEEVKKKMFIFHRKRSPVWI